MRALFAHDHIFFASDTGEIYSPGRLPYQAWSRYLSSFSELVVASRIRDFDQATQSLERMDRSSGDGVKFLGISSPSVRSRLTNPGFIAGDALSEAIRGVDAVIARLPSENGLRALRIARQLSIPHAVEVVGCAWDAYWNYGSLTGRLYAPIAMSRMRRAVARAPYAIYVTKDFLQSRYPAYGHTASASNVGIPVPNEEILERRLHALGNAGDEFTIGLIGSLKTRYKGLKTAIEALHQIRERVGPFHLKVLGDGDPQPWKELANRYGLLGKLEFCGILPSGPPVLEWLDDIDLYIQPSFTEGLPRSLIEAMSRGCPALGSTAGGIPELLSPDCLHRPGDPRQLATLMEKAFADRAWRRAQAEQNFGVSKEYGKDVLESRRLNFWQSFANHVRDQNNVQAREAIPSEARNLAK